VIGCEKVIKGKSELGMTGPWHRTRNLLVYSIATLLVTLPNGRVVAQPLSQEILELQNRPYVELPNGLCQGSSEALLGQVGNKEYSGVVCDRPTSAYIFLQQLVGYTSRGQSIWKIVAIQSLKQIQPGEFVVLTDCMNLLNSSKAIFALVVNQHQRLYRVRKAWEANLDAGRLQELAPTQVACKVPTLQMSISVTDPAQDHAKVSPQSANQEFCYVLLQQGSIRIKSD
jgi:hypothetical protein